MTTVEHCAPKPLCSLCGERPATLWRQGICQVCWNKERNAQSQRERSRNRINKALPIPAVVHCSTCRERPANPSIGDGSLCKRCADLAGMQAGPAESQHRRSIAPAEDHPWRRDGARLFLPQVEPSLGRYFREDDTRE